MVGARRRGAIANPALFSVTSTGARDVGIPGGLHGVREVLVTLERPGGSLGPHPHSVIVARLS